MEPVGQPRLEGLVEGQGNNRRCVLRHHQIIYAPAVLSRAPIGPDVKADAQVALVLVRREVNGLFGPLGADARCAIERGPTVAVGRNLQPRPVVVRQPIPIPKLQHRPGRAHQIHRAQRVAVGGIGIIAHGRIAQAASVAAVGASAPSARCYPLVGRFHRVGQRPGHRHRGGGPLVGRAVHVVGVHREHPVVIRRPNRKAGIGEVGRRRIGEGTDQGVAQGYGGMRRPIHLGAFEGRPQGRGRPGQIHRAQPRRERFKCDRRGHLLEGEVVYPEVLGGGAAVLVPGGKAQPHRLVDQALQRHLHPGPVLVPVIIKPIEITPVEPGIRGILHPEPRPIPQLSLEPEHQLRIDGVAQVQVSPQPQPIGRVGVHPPRGRVPHRITAPIGPVGVQRPRGVEPVGQPRLEGLVEGQGNDRRCVLRHHQIIYAPAVLSRAPIGPDVKADAQVALVLVGGEVNGLFGPLGADARCAIERRPTVAVGRNLQPRPVVVRQPIPIPEPQHRPDCPRQIHGGQSVTVGGVGVVETGRIREAGSAGVDLVGCRPPTPGEVPAFQRSFKTIAEG